jgi:hypothetical protein
VPVQAAWRNSPAFIQRRSFITYITRAIGTKVVVAVGVIAILGCIIAFGGIYLFRRHLNRAERIWQSLFWGLTQIITIAYDALVVAPVVLGLRFGVRVTVAQYAFEVILPVAPPTCCSRSAWRCSPSAGVHWWS